MLYIRTINIALPAPRLGIQLAGYSSRRGSTASNEELRASLLLLSDDEANEILIGTIDTLFVSPRFLRDLWDRGLKDKLLLFSTHTHNAPSLAHELPLLGEVDDDWYSHVIDRIITGVRELRGRGAQQISVAYGQVATHLNVNRRKRALVLNYRDLRRGSFKLRKEMAMAPNKYGIIDKRLRLLTFETEGVIRAVIWTLAAHAAFDPRYTEISPDFPGVVQEELAKKFGDDCCIVYLPGFAGSAIPNAKQRWIMPAREMLMRALPFFPMLPSYSVGGYRKWALSVVGELEKAYALRVRVDGATKISFAERRIPEVFTDKNSGKAIGLNIFNLSFGGSAGILGCSGEMLGEWMAHLDGMPLDKTLVSGYAGGECLYVPPADQLKEGGYEVDRFQRYFGLNGHFRADITDQVVGVIGELLENGC